MREVHARKLAHFQFEEAAFLCEYRITLRSQPDFEWHTAGPVETRIDTHLRALQAFPQDALPNLTDQAALGIGEFCASLRVHARDSDLVAFQQQLALVDIDDLPRMKLAAEALLSDAPDGLIEVVSCWLGSGNKVSKVVGALVLGHRGQTSNSDLIGLAYDNHPTLAGGAIWALGRCASGVDQSFFQTLCTHENPHIREIAGTALMRQFHVASSQSMLGNLDENTAPTSVLALSATKASSDTLRARFLAERSKLIVQAIGIAGDLSSVPMLIELLDDDEFGGVAAQSLDLMTGANLHETVWVADEMEDDELLDAELVTYLADGKLPVRPDGLPFGFARTRLSENPDVWLAWLKQNSELLALNGPIRLGQPASAGQSLRTLIEHSAPEWARCAAADELVARYQIRELFATEWTVHAQRQALVRIAQLIDQK